MASHWRQRALLTVDILNVLIHALKGLSETPWGMDMKPWGVSGL